MENFTYSDFPAEEFFYFNRVFTLFSTPWKAYLLAAIGGSILRFGEIRRMLASLSRVTVSKYLAELERDGFVSRVEYPAPPLRVEYSLTEMGKEILPCLQYLITWGMQQ